MNGPLVKWLGGSSVFKQDYGELKSSNALLCDIRRMFQMARVRITGERGQQVNPETRGVAQAVETGGVDGGC